MVHAVTSFVARAQPDSHPTPPGLAHPDPAFLHVDRQLRRGGQRVVSAPTPDSTATTTVTQSVDGRR